MKQDRVALRSEEMGEGSDCAVLALARILHVSYETSWEALYRAGRRPRGGTPRSVTQKALELLGFKIKRTWYPDDIAVATLPPGVTLRPTTVHPIRFKEGWGPMPDLLLFVPQHVAAYVDGKVQDWTQDKVVVIEEAWEITRASDEVKLGERLPPVIYLKGYSR